MISLFIDTSLTSVSISIIKDNKILSLIQKDMPSTYAKKYVKEALDNANIDANDIDNIMVVNGPGSLTGVKTGVAIAQTYGYLIRKKVTPISSLKSLAISSKYKGNIMSLIPANNNTYYIGIYDQDYNIIEAERIINNQEIPSLCNKYNPYIVSIDISVIGKYKVNKQNIDVLAVVNHYLDKEKLLEGK